MSDSYFDPEWVSKVTVPVKRVGDRWEFFYGGDVPVVEGTLGELTFSSHQISDEVFRQRVTSEATFKVLEEGCTLLVALNDRVSTDYYAGFESKHFPQGIPPGTSRWERVQLGPPRKKNDAKASQSDLFAETGGLWLTLKGLEKCELSTSSILMPAPFESEGAQSLNHAYTQLSKLYETHRISNTGNVYTRVYYQDSDECWYPLDDLRRGVQAKVERKLLRQLWLQVEQKLGWRPVFPAQHKRR